MDSSAALTPFDGDVTSPRGFRAAGVHCGLKASGRDLAMVVSEEPATVAGVFTTNKVQAAPVRYSRRIVAGGTAQAMVINSANANACTGSRGMKDAEEMAALTADALGLAPHQVLVASTGVIGIPLEMDPIRRGIVQCAQELGESGKAAADAILTTDTFAKTAAVRIDLPGRDTPVTLGGMAKGAGMICPDMATTLCFLTTDAALPAPVLAGALNRAITSSFNSITVDGETSTNDCAFLLANGLSDAGAVLSGEALDLFTAGLSHVALELAKMVVRDGEGATKFVRITVRGAVDEAEARRGAKTVANSLLVKTALFGEQPNWGRVVCALGRAGVSLAEEKVKLWFNDLQVVEGGLGLSQQDLEDAARELKAPRFDLTIDLGLGPGEACVWTCDLGHEYVRINGSYMS